jgi:uncharacterized metal-binding protein YceD (DUF177 family)
VNERFKIFPEQLRDGHVEQIEEVFEPVFIEIDDVDLAFKAPVNVVGEAYLADDNLVLHLNVKTIALMPCVICNEVVHVAIDVENLYHVEALDNIKSGVFLLNDLLREALLLEVPKFAECREGNCLAREALEKFMKKNASSTSSEELEGEGYRPFADIELDLKPKT